MPEWLMIAQLTMVNDIADGNPIGKGSQKVSVFWQDKQAHNYKQDTLRLTMLQGNCLPPMHHKPYETPGWQTSYKRCWKGIEGCWRVIDSAASNSVSETQMLLFLGKAKALHCFGLYYILRWYCLLRRTVCLSEVNVGVLSDQNCTLIWIIACYSLTSYFSATKIVNSLFLSNIHFWLR